MCAVLAIGGAAVGGGLSCPNGRAGRGGHTVVPGVPTTEQAELAWSAANDADDLFLPASWRPNRPGWVLRDHQRPQHPRLSGRGSHDGAGHEPGDARGPSKASVYAYGMVYSAIAAY